MRFGMFSSPAPLAVSDAQFPQKKPHKDEDGVIIAPRNILTRNVKKGAAIDSVLFSKAAFTSIDDPYKAHGNITARVQRNDLIEAAGHERVFRPAKTFREDKFKLPYTHMTDRVPFTKNFKDENGDIVTAPRNVQTNPMKRGKVGRNTNFTTIIDYMTNEYDAPK